MLGKRSVLGLFVECQFHGLVHPHSNIFSTSTVSCAVSASRCSTSRSTGTRAAAFRAASYIRYPRRRTPGRCNGATRCTSATRPRPATRRIWKTALSPHKLLKLACLFELYGMPDCAADLLLAYRATLDDLVDVQWCLDALAAEVDPGTKGFEDTNRRFEASPTSFYPATGS